MLVRNPVRYTRGPERQMGQVHTTITVTNEIDAANARHGRLAQSEVRSMTLERVLVDTGATFLSLPQHIVDYLGLDPAEQVEVQTATGPAMTWIYGGVRLEVQGRSGSFDCLALPGGDAVLLGVFPMEVLGLRPDLKNPAARIAAEQGPGHIHLRVSAERTPRALCRWIRHRPPRMTS